MTEIDENLKGGDLDLALEQMEDDMDLVVRDRAETLRFLADQFEIPAPASAQENDE